MKHPLSPGKHVVFALLMIKENPIVPFFITIIGMCSALTIVVRETALFWPLNIFTAFVSIAATPIFYGIYLELIEDTYSSIRQIAKTYLPRYLWLILRMYVPALFLAGLPATFSSTANISGFFETTLIGFSLLYLYVIPVFYTTGTQHGAIVQGVRFLYNHLLASAPLILSVLCLETAMLLFQHYKIYLARYSVLFLVITDFSVYLIASLADLMIFIIILLTLKESQYFATTGGPSPQKRDD